MLNIINFNLNSSQLAQNSLDEFVSKPISLKIKLDFACELGHKAFIITEIYRINSENINLPVILNTERIQVPGRKGGGGQRSPFSKFNFL